MTPLKRLFETTYYVTLVHLHNYQKAWKKGKVVANRISM
jgi:hypothetical protein